MELITIIVATLAIIIVNAIMNTNLKELEKIALDEKLNEIAKKYPKNIEICKNLLNKLGNKTTNVEEDENSNATLYLVTHNKISIGKTQESFTRLQTMAHECLHSVQDKKILWFNFVFSNFYLIYFMIISLLVIIRKLPNEIIFLNIFLILSFIYYVIRVFLENDAMIKAEYLTKEYMMEQNISSKEECEKIMQGLKKINKGAIKATNCSLFVKIMVKVVIFNILALIF